jgi:hypothetical protein
VKKLILFAVFLLPVVAIAQNICVSFNGFYAYKIDKDNSAVIRFYEDGTVIASTSTNDYKHVATWFTKENADMVLQGKYKLKKCKSVFTVKGATGEQKYQIEINPETLDAVITDKKSKKSTKRNYTFVSS